MAVCILIIMEFSREERRAIIKFLCANGENCVNIHRELVSVCGDEALDYSNVNRWVEKFKTGRVSSADFLRSGRPCSSRTAANTERVNNLILGDLRLTIEEICAKTGLTHGSVVRIIKDDLKMTKVSARWVPRMLDENKKHIVTEFLLENGIETLRHPPYSPDLAPSDFWLFDTLKNTLQGRQFSSKSSLGLAVYQSLKHISKDSYKTCFENWVELWQKCLDKEGDYVE